MDIEGAMSVMGSLSEVQTPEELHKRVGDAVRKLGCDHFLIGMQRMLPAGVMLQHVDSGYPSAWQKRYAEKKFILVDPLIGYCQTNTAPVIWNPVLYSERSLELMEESRAHGLQHGLSVPVHESTSDKSMFSMARDQVIDDPRESARLVTGGKVLANCVHVAMARLVYPALLAAKTPELTPRELECLRYIALGKGSQATADILNLQKDTVDYHVSKVMRKLGVATRIQAVAMAVQLKILT